MSTFLLIFKHNTKNTMCNKNIFKDSGCNIISMNHIYILKVFILVLNEKYFQLHCYLLLAILYLRKAVQFNF